ncbi:MAG: nitrogen regulation protein, partial [Pseudomonadota bacterium]
YYRVGGHSAVKANVRVIAATHQNLEQRVREGAFREDLFHRLNVIRLRLPALRERREDVPLLARYFLQQSALQLGVEPKRISEAALQRLSAFDFPGNVRQLENICHWLTVMAPAQLIETKDLPPEVLGQQPGPAAASAPAGASGPDSAQPAAPPLPSDESLAPVAAPVPAAADLAWLQSGAGLHAAAAQWEQGLQDEALALLAQGRTDVWNQLSSRFETRLIQAALAATRGRRIEAAHKLGIGRNTITRKIQELGLE